MSRAKSKILRVTILVDETDSVEMAFVHALLTRLNILHARLQGGDLNAILDGRKLGSLYKNRANVQTSSNGMVKNEAGPLALPAPQKSQELNPSANERQVWRRGQPKKLSGIRILKIIERKMPLPLDIVEEN
jgi:hypothetical protein